MVNGTLTIYNVAKTDGGTYLCNTKNIIGSKTVTALVVIFFPLRFKIRPPQELTLMINISARTLRLPCLAESDLKPTITWTKDGKPSLPVDSDVLQNGTLILRNIKKSYEGSYTCRATNALITIEAEVKINVPVATSSCSVIKKYVSSKSGNYVIDPDGEGGLAPFTVFCDMTDKSGVGVTVISHDSEKRTYVRQKHYGSQDSYSRDIHYTGASFSQLASLTRVSLHCEQFIKYECHRSVLLYNNSPFGWWVSRDSQKMRYWGGASVAGKCACGMTNSCANTNYMVVTVTKRTPCCAKIAAFLLIRQNFELSSSVLEILVILTSILATTLWESLSAMAYFKGKLLFNNCLIEKL